uniref:AlNc14C234G9349 protein n=1 Tax=Albugo laibachii Nc14 TaxID=890382 RepID=F0WSK4_9STRA|nr:AlNc14C234G9349 [Albugo laibachii Nc14]|eukprot:CCA24330.1 AlNc14C234G9349 [Albugo laibachii Nc14]
MRRTFGVSWTPTPKVGFIAYPTHKTEPKTLDSAESFCCRLACPDCEGYILHIRSDTSPSIATTLNSPASITSDVSSWRGGVDQQFDPLGSHTVKSRDCTWEEVSRSKSQNIVFVDVNLLEHACAR